MLLIVLEEDNLPTYIVSYIPSSTATTMRVELDSPVGSGKADRVRSIASVVSSW